jgi:hypothetical protein
MKAGAANGIDAPRQIPRVTKVIPAPKNDDEFIAMLRAAFMDPVRHRSIKAIYELMEYLTPQNALQTRELFKEFSKLGIRLDDAWFAFWVRWGEIDGAGVMERLVSDETEIAEGYWHFENAMLGWATVDSIAAEAWLTTHRDAPFYDKLYHSLVLGCGYTDLERATEIAFALLRPRSPMIDNAMGAVAQDAFRTGGIPAVARWFEGLNESAKKLAMIHVHWCIIHGDPRLAQEWFTGQADKSWRNDKHIPDFMPRLIDVSGGGAAMEWLIELPRSGDGNPPGLRTSMEHWTSKAPAEARHWLDKHRDERWWPRAAAGYLRTLRKDKNTAPVDLFLQALDDQTRKAIEAESK